jgi:hypothetical protein
MHQLKGVILRKCIWIGFLHIYEKQIYCYIFPKFYILSKEKTYFFALLKMYNVFPNVFLSLEIEVFLKSECHVEKKHQT